ncbi:hypothetical protein [uncultured Tolumonas sp.]|uniref:hypothetical protein n=1 Tax=uncultured Tolumonas sp. TaxID=263765 RepID=UPI00292E7543|nr:hypothetical protein [uncultured Tolumonas sp.]
MNNPILQPIDTSIMRLVGGQLGSNFAGIFEDDNEQRYYVKELESPMLAKNEWIAAKLYQLAGAPTLTYIPTVEQNQVATLWEKLDKQNLAQFSENERRQAQQWFAVHAWTANWDALGLHGDNQGVLNEKVLTIDIGGALLFRACGDPKGKAFSDDVNEIDTLRTQQDNRHAYELFGSMSELQLIDALARVSRIADEAIRNTILLNDGSEKLAIKMVNRKHFITDKLAQIQHPR